MGAASAVVRKYSFPPLLFGTVRSGRFPAGVIVIALGLALVGAGVAERARGAVCCGLGRKSLSGEMPATTGASAAGICGSTMFAMCVSPASSKEWILVAKALSICPVVPENSIVV